MQVGYCNHWESVVIVRRTLENSKNIEPYKFTIYLRIQIVRRLKDMKL